MTHKLLDRFGGCSEFVVGREACAAVRHVGGLAVMGGGDL